MAYNSGARRRAARKKKPVAPKKTSTKKTSTGGKMNRKKTVTSGSKSVTPKRTSTGGKMNRKKTGAATGATATVKATPPKTAPKKRTGQMNRGNTPKLATAEKGHMYARMPREKTPYTGQGGARRLQESKKKDVTGGVKTKAGTYKTFKKDSNAAADFRKTFAIAKKKGYKTFTWNGKKYSTKTK